MPGREEILAAADLARIEVDIPEWGGRYYVGELSGLARGELERQISEHLKANTFREHHRALAVIACLTDETGIRIFTYADTDALSAKSGKVLERIGKYADKLNKLSDEEIEGLAKNSEPSRAAST